MGSRNLLTGRGCSFPSLGPTPAPTMEYCGWLFCRWGLESPVSGVQTLPEGFRMWQRVPPPGPPPLLGPLFPSSHLFLASPGPKCHPNGLWSFLLWSEVLQPVLSIEVLRNGIRPSTSIRAFGGAGVLRCLYNMELVVTTYCWLQDWDLSNQTKLLPALSFESLISASSFTGCLHRPSPCKTKQVNGEHLGSRKHSFSTCRILLGWVG